MTDTPHETPEPSATGSRQPAVKGAEGGRAGQVGPEDTTGEDGSPYPDPDEYADPEAQGSRSPEDGSER